MSGVEAFLGARASFVLAALAVSWIAVVLLALVTANLHFRLAHLERSLREGDETRAPYGHLLGRSLIDLLGPDPPLSPPRVALVLASDCPACERILDEIREAGSVSSVSLLWRDGTPSPRPPLPPGVTVLEDGPRLSRLLGVGVTPFALAADDAGHIVQASPVSSVKKLRELLGEELGTPPDRPPVPLANFR